jgi:RNA polymerase sigma-70 factor (ECF subfamily)
MAIDSNENYRVENPEDYCDSSSSVYINGSDIYHLQNDNEETFKKVFEGYHKKLYFYFLKKTKSTDISEELVQETFIKLWLHRKRLNGSLSLSVQLFRIAKTTLIDLLRRKAKSRVYSLPSEKMILVSEQFTAQSETIEPHSLLFYLKNYLYKLSPMRRKIIEQRLEGFSNQEIALNLSISVKTVENQINKAFHDIRQNVSIPLILFLLVIYY